MAITYRLITILFLIIIIASPSQGWVDSPFSPLYIESKIAHDDLTTYDRFGWALDVDGDYCIIGAHGKNNYEGAAYIFYNEDGSWVQIAKLTVSDGEDHDLLGGAVAICGDLAVASARGREAVYVFEKPAAGWQDMTETAKLEPVSVSYNNYFGDAVDVSGDYVVVGAWGELAAFVYEKPAEGWTDTTETARLEPDYSIGGFSYDVAIDGDYIAVGAHWYRTTINDPYTGAVFVYNRDTDWQFQTVAVPQDTPVDGHCGQTVDIHGDRIIASAYGTNAAYVFHRDGESWPQEAKLNRHSNHQLDFGDGVSILGDTVIVGCYADNEHGRFSGSASVFCRQDTGWQHMVRITASDAEAGLLFGYAVGLSPQFAIVGAYGDNGDSSSSGQAYAFSNYTLPTSLGIRDRQIVTDFHLEQNYPNPFNPSTTIRFTIDKAGETRLSVYNILGKKVQDLVNRYLLRGNYDIQFNAGNLASGVYFIKLESAGRILTRKMMHVK